MIGYPVETFEYYYYYYYYNNTKSKEMEITPGKNKYLGSLLGTYLKEKNLSNNSLQPIKTKFWEQEIPYTY